MRMTINDWFIVLSVIMFLIAHVSTIIVIGKLAGNLPEQTMKQILEVAEANPGAKMTLQLGQISFILRFLLIPAIIGGTYYAFRRREFNDPKDKELVLSGFAGIMFFAALINSVNDLAVLVTYL